MTHPAPDQNLERLTPLERQLLILLGRGHTAKSIAALQGLSELAVNERFRAARRKTGIGSSREIARLLVAQENRDDIIGVAEPTAAPPVLPRPDAPRRASFLRRWSLPMSATAVLIAAAILAQQTAVLPTPTIALNQGSEPDVALLRTEIVAGPADPAWSPVAETTLSQAYRDFTAPAGVSVRLDVTCTRSLCEVVGVTPTRLTDDQKQKVIAAVQAPQINSAIAAAGLQNLVQTYTASETVTERGASSVVFSAYWRRTN